MRIEYEPNLIEQAVFLAARRDSRLERGLHAETDRLYALPPGRARDSTFCAVYAEYFRRLGFDSILPRLVSEPVFGGFLSGGVGRCLVREAVRARDECADLRVRASGETQTAEERTLMIQLVPASLLERERLESRLRPELLHVADMLDPAFGYDRRSLDGSNPERNLLRDRYRVLWDIYVERRIAETERTGCRAISRLRGPFTRAFGRYGADASDRGFDNVSRAAKLNHATIMAWARDPTILFAQPDSPLRNDFGVRAPCELLAP